MNRFGVAGDPSTARWRTSWSTPGSPEAVTTSSGISVAAAASSAPGTFCQVSGPDRSTTASAPAGSATPSAMAPPIEAPTTVTRSAPCSRAQSTISRTWASGSEVSSSEHTALPQPHRSTSTTRTPCSAAQSAYGTQPQ